MSERIIRAIAYLAIGCVVSFLIVLAAMLMTHAPKSWCEQAGGTSVRGACIRNDAVIVRP